MLKLTIPFDYKRKYKNDQYRRTSQEYHTQSGRYKGKKKPFNNDSNILIQKI